MKKYVVVDLEMCKVPKKKRTREFHWATETIQIGAVLLDENFEIVDKFDTYVAPRFGFLTPDIRRLTGITEENLQDAPDISEALDRFCRWVPEDAALVSWSESDPYQFQHEIMGKDLYDISGKLMKAEWIDCQELFDNKIGPTPHKSYSLLNAMNLSDIDYDEHLHNGLTDAWNTALLFKKLMLTPDYEFNHYYKSVDEGEQESERLSSSLGSLLAGFCLE